MKIENRHFFGAIVLFTALVIPSFSFCKTSGTSEDKSYPLFSNGRKNPQQNNKNIKSDSKKREFSKNIFGKKDVAPPLDPHIAKQLAKVNVLTAKEHNAVMIQKHTEISVSGGKKQPSKEDISPKHVTFNGADDTLSRMDEETPTQVNVNYPIDEKVSARISVNSQDANSPTYTPLKKEEGLNAAGVYIDMAVDKDLKVQMGGEVRNNETVNESSNDQSSAGASIGILWEF